jgi:ABC-type transporter MlaC component
MTRSTIRGERKLALAAIALSLAMASMSPPAAAMNNGGSDAVRSLYDTLLATMRNGPALGAHGRYARIEPVVRQVFDIPFMTRLAVGPEWAGLSEAQRQQVTQAFRALCRGNLRRAVRQLFRRAASGHRRAGVARRHDHHQPDRQVEW